MTDRGTRIGVAALCVLALSAGMASAGTLDVGTLAGATAGTNAADASGASAVDCGWSRAVNATHADEGPAVDVRVERRVAGPNRTVAAYRLRYDLPTGARNLSLVLGPRAADVRVEGFERVGDRRYRAVPGADRHAVWLDVDLSAAREESGGSYAAGRGWMLAPLPVVRHRWVAETVDGPAVRCGHLRHPGTPRTVTAPNATATASHQAVLVGLGPHERQVLTANGTEIRVVVPSFAGVDRVDGRAVVDDLVLAERSLRVGSRAERVTVFVLPPNGAHGGRAFGTAHPGSRTVWVNARATEGLGNVRIHEYVHAKQDFRPREDMRWFVEASAQYYAYLIPYQHRADLDGRALRRALAGTNGTVHAEPSEGAWRGRTVLANPDSWAHEANYDRGAAVLYGLDVRLRMATDGETTLLDLIRWLNGREEPVPYAAFRAAVVARSDPSVGRWLDARVEGTAPVRVEADPGFASDPVPPRLTDVNASREDE